MGCDRDIDCEYAVVCISCIWIALVLDRACCNGSCCVPRNEAIEEEMKSSAGIWFIVVMLSLLTACTYKTTPNNTTPNTTSNTTMNVTDEKYCMSDSDCVRQSSCCDCGLGNYVNKKYYHAPQCEQRCMCATQQSIGKCENNVCIGIQARIE
jgi:hypothetical protein